MGHKAGMVKRGRSVQQRLRAFQGRLQAHGAGRKLAERSANEVKGKVPARPSSGNQGILRIHDLDGHRLVHEAIRKWREERRLGLRQFAKAVGVSPTFISKMERGTGALPGEATIRKMAETLGKNPDELLAMADKVAEDVLAIIKKEPAISRFLRANPHLTKDELKMRSQSLTDRL